MVRHDGVDAGRAPRPPHRRRGRALYPRRKVLPVPAAALPAHLAVAALVLRVAPRATLRPTVLPVLVAPPATGIGAVVPPGMGPLKAAVMRDAVPK